MSEPSPSDPASIDESERPVLDYRRPGNSEQYAKPSRHQLPPKFAFGFLGAVGVLCVGWPLLAERPVHHLVVFIAAGLAAVGVAMLSVAESRLAGAGVVCAFALWLLLVGTCSAIGFVKPGVL